MRIQARFVKNRFRPVTNGAESAAPQRRQVRSFGHAVQQSAWRAAAHRPYAVRSASGFASFGLDERLLEIRLRLPESAAPRHTNGKH